MAAVTVFFIRTEDTSIGSHTTCYAHGATKPSFRSRKQAIDDMKMLKIYLRKALQLIGRHPLNCTILDQIMLPLPFERLIIMKTEPNTEWSGPLQHQLVRQSYRWPISLVRDKSEGTQGLLYRALSLRIRPPSDSSQFINHYFQFLPRIYPGKLASSTIRIHIISMLTALPALDRTHGQSRNTKRTYKCIYRTEQETTA